MVEIKTGRKHCIIYSIIFSLYSLSFIHEELILSEKRAKRTDIFNPSFGGRFKNLTHINAVIKFCSINYLVVIKIQ